MTRLRALISGCAIATVFFGLLPVTISGCGIPPSIPALVNPTPRPTQSPEERAQIIRDLTQEFFQTADIVFRGQAKQVDVYPSGTTYPLATNVLHGVLVVDRVWKGSVSPEITVYSHKKSVSSCDVAMQLKNPPHELSEQQTYLIYAQFDAQTGTFEISRLITSQNIQAEIAIIGPGNPVITTTPTPSPQFISPPSAVTSGTQRDATSDSNYIPPWMIGCAVFAAGLAIVGLLRRVGYSSRFRRS